MSEKQNSRSDIKVNKARRERIQKDTLLRLFDIAGSLSKTHLQKLFPEERERTTLIRYLKSKFHLICQGDRYYISDSLARNISYPDNDTVSVFMEFVARADYFTQATYPALICFFIDHQEYEIIRCEAGAETIVTKAASLVNEPPLRIIVVDEKAQIPQLRLQNVFAFAVVNDDGDIQFFKTRESTK